jgi:transcription-repair coupling factor (superfamily II helicase)
VAFLQELEGPIASGSVLIGLPAGAAAWAAAALARQAPEPLLVVLARSDDAPLMVDALRLFLPELPVLPLPADDVPPYDGYSPNSELPRQRLVALDLLRTGRAGVVVADARAMQHRVLPPDRLAAATEVLREGDHIERAALAARLVDRGYLVTPAADEPGTVAWRGGLVDLWPPGHRRPVRIELDDTTVEELRELDPQTGRSVGRIDRVNLLPAREGVVDAAALERAAATLAAGVDALGFGHATRRRVLEELRAGLWFPGAEDYLPALHPLVDVRSYASRVLIVDRNGVRKEAQRFEAQAQERWERLLPAERPPLLPRTRYTTADELLASLTGATRIEELAPEGGPEPMLDFQGQDNRSLRIEGGELAPVAGRLGLWRREGWSVALVADSESRAERLAALLQPHGLALVRPGSPGPSFVPGQLALWIGALAHGFHAPRSKIAVVAAEELYGERSHSRAPTVPKRLRDAVVSQAADLKRGDLVVHARHGIGRFEGLKRIQSEPRSGEYDERGAVVEQDCVLVTYRDGDRLYLPVSRLDQLYRYRADSEAAVSLDRLGGDSWATRKAKVKARVLAMAHELLALHARRSTVPGHAYEGTPELYVHVEQSFPYVETPDQAQAISDVLADLARPEAMDRLVVGDVGFGKTEVALRAAVRVVLESRQVLIVCPTTLLAWQHHRTFVQRLEGLPITVGLAAGVQSAAENRQVLADVALGRVDVLVTTHTAMGRALRFRHLGLVVVDEEHRFGVRQKEKLKRLAQTAAAEPVDMLAMSATPIPRSLHMALTGLRPVSMITTAPAGRRAVKTRVVRWNDERIREEILHELRRGGQVFFVHNRVETLESVRRTLQELVPEARIGVAHGQMAPQQMEAVHLAFLRRDLHVLLCTTIIESGVDIPNVNTMIINQAHELGLAQLYQLRGRVGRADRKGYCTLLVPADGELTATATRRLRVLQENTELGSGFAIASADLELRGAGNLLGDQQHGHIQTVGFETYVELLEEAVAEAQGKLSAERLDPDVDVPVAALLPETWIDDVTERLTEYRRLAGARTVHAVRDLVGEWEERYGSPPPEVLNLGWGAEARIRCRELGIERLTWLKLKVVLDFHETTKVDPKRIVELVGREGARFALGRGAGAPPPPPPTGVSAERGGRTVRGDARRQVDKVAELLAQQQEEARRQALRDAAKAAPTRLIVRYSPEEGEWPYRFLHWVFRRLEGAERG